MPTFEQSLQTSLARAEGSITRLRNENCVDQNNKLAISVLSDSLEVSKILQKQEFFNRNVSQTEF